MGSKICHKKRGEAENSERVEEGKRRIGNDLAVWVTKGERRRDIPLRPRRENREGKGLGDRRINRGH